MPGTGVWTVGGLANGGSTSLQIFATVASSGGIVNQATKTAQGEADPNSSNNSALVGLNASALADIQVQQTVDNATPILGANVTFTLTVKNAGPSNASVTLNGGVLADLALSKTASQEPVAAGANFVYTIVVVNNGPFAATGVTVTDDLTTVGVTLNSATASQGLCTGNPEVSCNLGTLQSGGSATVTLAVTKTVGGSISNIASVTANEAVPNLANNSNGETSTPVELMNFVVE